MKTSISSNPELMGKRVFTGLIIVGGLFLTYKMFAKELEKLRKYRTSGQADESPEVQQAILLRTAMNPIGITFLDWIDGTMEKEINEIARGIFNFDEVLKAYRNLYGRELLVDLQGELSTEDITSFMAIITNNKANQSSSNAATPTDTYTVKGRLIVAKQAVVLRTSPDASFQGNWYEFTSINNIHRKASAGEFLGYATGRQQFDATNKVKFIEIAYRVIPSPSVAPFINEAGRTIILWVSSSSNYTEQFDSVSKMLSKYPQNQTASQQIIALNGIGSRLRI